VLEKCMDLAGEDSTKHADCKTTATSIANQQLAVDTESCEVAAGEDQRKKTGCTRQKETATKYIMDDIQDAMEKLGKVKGQIEKAADGYISCKSKNKKLVAKERDSADADCLTTAQNAGFSTTAQAEKVNLKEQEEATKIASRFGDKFKNSQGTRMAAVDMNKKEEDMTDEELAAKEKRWKLKMDSSNQCRMSLRAKEKTKRWRIK